MINFIKLKYVDSLRRVFSLLTGDEKKQAFSLFGLMFVGMLLEMLGVSFIVPAITLFTQDNILDGNIYFSKIFLMLGNPNKELLITYLMFAIVAIYFIKNMFLALLAWYQNRFSFGLQVSLSQRLFELYLRQPYTFHLQHNSAQLIRNVQIEVSMFTANFVSPLIQLSTEALVLSGLVFLMFIVEPVGTLIVMMILGIAAFAFQYIAKDKISHWGKARQYHDGLRIQHLHQGLNGTKDIKLLGRESDFLNQFAIHNSESAKMNKFHAFLKQLPRLWLELLGITGLSILVISMLFQNKEVENILPVLGLFTAIAFRLIPSINRILSSMQQLQYGVPVIKTLTEEFNLRNIFLTNSNANQDVFFNKELSINNVSYTYPGKISPALDKVSFTIKRGESIGFVGHTGCGKSTMIDVILGLIMPDDGQILVDQNNIIENIRGWQDKIGYVPQNIYLTDDSIKKNVAFGLSNEKIDEVDVLRALEAAQLDDFINSLQEKHETFVGERGIRLSGGQRQRIGIARALYHNPEVLVLDEATSSLDGITEKAIMNVINSLSKKITIIMVAHRLSTVRNCDVIYVMDNGKIVDSGTYNELIQRNEKFRTMSQ